MPKYFTYILLVAIVTGGLATWVGNGLAAQFFSDELVAPADEIDDDVFAIGQRVQFRHPVGSDLFVTGNTIDIVGPVADNVFAAGNEVNISGEIGDDIFVLANKANISSSQADDVFVAASRLDIKEEARIQGDVYAAASTIDIRGNIEGTVRVAGENITVSAEAVIAGDLIVNSQNPPTIAEGSQIAGEITHRRTAGGREQNYILSWVRGVLAWFLIALVLLYLLPRGTRTAVRTADDNVVRSLAVGFVWTLLFIPVVLLLMMSVLGIPLALLLATSTFALFLLAMALTVVWVGQKAYGHLAGDGQTIGWQQVLLGAVLVKTIALIPIAGGIINILLYLIVFGAVLSSIWTALRSSGQETV